MVDSSSSSSQSLSSQSLSSESSASPTSCTLGIKLRRYIQSRYVQGMVDGFRFKVVAYAACGMSKYIFRYLRRPLNTQTGEDADEFDGICSSVDIEELPIGEPTTGQQPPFFRLAELDLVFRSRAEGDDVWTIIKEDVQTLVTTLKTMDKLDVAEDVSFGDPSDESPPS